MLLGLSVTSFYTLCPVKWCSFAVAGLFCPLMIISLGLRVSFSSLAIGFFLYILSLVPVILLNSEAVSGISSNCFLFAPTRFLSVGFLSLKVPPTLETAFEATVVPTLVPTLLPTVEP